MGISLEVIPTLKLFGIPLLTCYIKGLILGSTGGIADPKVT